MPFDCSSYCPLLFYYFLYQESSDKANILNEQFKSAFTKENPNEKMPELNSEKFPSINNIKVDISGVEKLLKNLDSLSNIVLKECSNELATIISHIF